MGVKKLKQDVKFIAGNKEKGRVVTYVGGLLLEDKEYLSYTLSSFTCKFLLHCRFSYGPKNPLLHQSWDVIIEGNRGALRRCIKGGETL